MLAFSQPKNLSKFRAFGCQAFKTICKERRGQFQFAPRALEGINLGFATDSNTSGFVIYIPESRRVYISNQVGLNENSFLYKKQSALGKCAANVAG
jgi:hypothetical protein